MTTFAAPLNTRALPYRPPVVHVAFESVPENWFADASTVLVPDPSSNPKAATKVGSLAIVVTLTLFEYGPRLLAASNARTMYEYVVFRVRPVSLSVVDDVVASLTNEVQFAPTHRSTRYPAIPTLSVAAPQVRSIWPPLMALPV